MAVFGAYYALTQSAASSKIAPIHFGLTVITVLVIVPGIAMAITEKGETLAVIGSFLAVGSMAMFLFVVIRHGVGKPVPHDITDVATQTPSVE